MTAKPRRPAAPAITPAEMARRIDHTLLKPQATAADILRLCDEARMAAMAAVCVNPVYVPLAAERLTGSDVRVCTVVGFPLGATATAVKVLEARLAIESGAREIDSVMFVGGLKGGDETAVLDDLRAVAEVCRSTGALCKVILETCLLTDEEKDRAVELAARSGAHYVKTSTGFGAAGATVEDVTRLAARAHPLGVCVKASGGIRSLDDALRMLAAGADRIGTSNGAAILRELEGRTSA